MRIELTWGGSLGGEGTREFKNNIFTTPRRILNRHSLEIWRYTKRFPLLSTLPWVLSLSLSHLFSEFSPLLPTFSLSHKKDSFSRCLSHSFTNLPPLTISYPFLSLFSTLTLIKTINLLVCVKLPSLISCCARHLLY